MHFCFFQTVFWPGGESRRDTRRPKVGQASFLTCITLVCGCAEEWGKYVTVTNIFPRNRATDCREGREESRIKNNDNNNMTLKTFLRDHLRSICERKFFKLSSAISSIFPSFRWHVHWRRIARTGMLVSFYVRVYMTFGVCRQRHSKWSAVPLHLQRWPRRWRRWRWWRWVLTGQGLLRGGPGCVRGKQSVLLSTTGRGFPPNGRRERGAIFPLGIRRIRRPASSL